jgi:hypothetical protein
MDHVRRGSVLAEDRDDAIDQAGIAGRRLEQSSGLGGRFHSEQ